MGKKLISKDQGDLVAELYQDVQKAFQNVAGNDQFWCRALVRAVFAYFEAHGHVIRSAVLKLLKPKKSDIESIAKIALLANTAYEPSSTGKLKETREPKTQFINYFALTLRSYAEAAGMAAADIDKFFGNNAYDQLQRAKKVRDRLMHPKKLGDITVTQVEVMYVTNAFNTVRQFVSDVEQLLK